MNYDLEMHVSKKQAKNIYYMFHLTWLLVLTYILAVTVVLWYWMPMFASSMSSTFQHRQGASNLTESFQWSYLGSFTGCWEYNQGEMWDVQRNKYPKSKEVLACFIRIKKRSAIYRTICSTKIWARHLPKKSSIPNAKTSASFTAVHSLKRRQLPASPTKKSSNTLIFRGCYISTVSARRWTVNKKRTRWEAFLS